MNTAPKPNNNVALVADAPDVKLTRGQVGTVVEVLSPTQVLVEFSDDDDNAHSIVPLSTAELRVLHYEQEVA